MNSKSMRARRNLLVALFGVPVAAAVGAESTDAPAKPRAVLKKYPKERVGYKDEAYLGRTCSKCVLYVGDGECAIVDGTVSPEGWCTQWTPATIG